MEIATLEIIGSTHEQRSWLQGFIGILTCQFERLDKDIWNVTVPNHSVDNVYEWVDNNNLKCRLV